eukprot:8714685-Alexandrium_andersonii.AAC.1
MVERNSGPKNFSAGPAGRAYRGAARACARLLLFSLAVFVGGVWACRGSFLPASLWFVCVVLRPLVAFLGFGRG